MYQVTPINDVIVRPSQVYGTALATEGWRIAELEGRLNALHENEENRDRQLQEAYDHFQRQQEVFSRAIRALEVSTRFLQAQADRASTLKGMTLHIPESPAA